MHRVQRPTPYSASDWRPAPIRTCYPPPMFGSHLSIAGGMVNALIEAEKLGMDTYEPGAPPVATGLLRARTLGIPTAPLACARGSLSS